MKLYKTCYLLLVGLPLQWSAAIPSAGLAFAVMFGPNVGLVRYVETTTHIPTTIWGLILSLCAASMLLRPTFKVFSLAMMPMTLYLSFSVPLIVYTPTASWVFIPVAFGYLWLLTKLYNIAIENAIKDMRSGPISQPTTKP